MELTPVSPSRRFMAWALEIVLISGTAYIGWFIWSLITWGKGQTPSQNLFRITSINEATGTPAKRVVWLLPYGVPRKRGDNREYRCLQALLATNSAQGHWHKSYLLCRGLYDF
jgi:hypothetical protein